MLCIGCNLKRNEAEVIAREMTSKGYETEIRIDVDNRTAVFANVNKTDWVRAEHYTDYPEKH